MEIDELKALSPLDGRYANKVGSLRDILSEYGLIRYRVMVEIRWLQCLAEHPEISDLTPVDSNIAKAMNRIIDDFTVQDAEHIKSIEHKTNHDVKAVEYFIREITSQEDQTDVLSEFIHFGCTSEDINNLAYALMLRAARDDVLLPTMKNLGTQLEKMATKYAEIPMLSRTHGQTASPTTLGKELANVSLRLERAKEQLTNVAIRGKFNGAVGNFNAHTAAYPGVDWPAISTDFIESLGLEANTHTTQIEPHDWMAEYCHALIRFNTILIDLCRDLWGYIGLGYFKLNLEANEVGSSTMPHKVNPIDFENAEGNLGIANALLDHMALKLPISRWQRDLSDSTVQRNFGTAVGHCLVSLHSIQQGLKKVQADKSVISADIEGAWEVLAEPIQTVMRRYAIMGSYEKLKDLTRGKKVTKALLHEFINELEIPENDKNRLLKMTPESYLGLAKQLAKDLPSS